MSPAERIRGCPVNQIIISQRILNKEDGPWIFDYYADSLLFLSSIYPIFFVSKKCICHRILLQ